MNNLAKLKELVVDIANENSSSLLQDIVQDLTEAKGSDIYILPVAHHSVASAIKTQQILEKRKPKVIFLELPTDYQELIKDLKHCNMPVALNAINYGIPLIAPNQINSFKAPITEFSAEFQAIKYGQTHNIPVVLVDLTCEERLRKTAELHQTEGGLFTLEMGDIKPSKERFVTKLVENTSTSNFSEFWSNIMEASLLAASFGQYRLQMFFIGSLFRRMGHEFPRNKILDVRDKTMWTNMANYLQDNTLNPDDAIFICGASHAVPVVKEFGKISHTGSIPAIINKWHYGILVSSYADIDEQFYEFPGTTFEKDRLWKTYKSIKPGGNISIKSFSHEKLMKWAVDITKLARNHGYTTSTADSIAIIEIYYQLGKLRNRSFLSKQDFIEAAMVCIDKNEAGLISLHQIFKQYFLTNDKKGEVGFGSLPPLTRDIINNLKNYGFKYKKRTVHRFLLDFKEDPELRVLSALLWKLHRLGINVVPIMGTNKFGEKNRQESWEVYIARDPNSLIELGYRGISLNEILKRELLSTIKPDSRLIEIFAVYKEVLQYLPDYSSVQQDLMQELLTRLTTTLLYQDNLEIYLELSDILNYFRGSEDGIPKYFSEFLSQSYKIYCHEVPKAFETDIMLSSLVGILTFIKQFESIVISNGGSRGEFEVALSLIDVANLPPEKYAIYLIAKSTLEDQIMNQLRQIFYKTYSNPLTLHRIPGIVEGLLYATYLSKDVTPLLTELLDQAFRRMDDTLLIKWIPQLIEILSEIDQVILSKLKGVIYTAYSKEDVTIWYDLKGYETGNFQSTPIKTAIQVKRTHYQGIILEYKHSSQQLAHLLGLDTEFVRNTETVELGKSKLLTKYPHASLQVSSLKGVAISPTRYKTNLGYLYPNTTKQVQSLIGGTRK